MKLGWLSPNGEFVECGYRETPTELFLGRKKMNNHEHIIGVWYDNEYAKLVTLSDLKDLFTEKFNTRLYWYRDCDPNWFTDVEGDYKKKVDADWYKYFDFRYNVNLYRFSCCPICGEKLDWKKMKNMVF